MSEEPLDVETVDETKPAAEPKAAEKSDGAQKAASVSGEGAHKGGGRSWTAGRVGTQMGVPPSALRNLKTEPVAGIKGLGKAQWNAGQHWAGKLGGTVATKMPTAGGKALVKGAARLIPGVGSIVAGFAAWKSFKDGDYVASVLNLIGVIPGPIGWLGMGAAAAWDLSGVGHPGVWEAPDGVTTFMLPASAKDCSGIKELDALLCEAQQQQVFGFQDGPEGAVWNASPPKALKLDTPEVEKAFTNWLRGVSELFAEVDRTMSQSDEPYLHQYRKELAPHLAAMAELKSQVKPLMTQLSAASKSGADMYRAVLDANKSARQQLANDGHLSDQGPATAMKAKSAAAQTQLDAANDKIGKLFDTAPAPIITAKSPTLNAPAAPSTRPAPLPMSATLPPVVAPAIAPVSKDKGDDLGKLLSGLGNKGLGGAPGGSPLGGSPLGGGHGGGTPLTTPTSKPADTEPKKLVEDKKDDTKKREEKSLPKPLPTNNPVAPVTPAPTTPAPGTPAPGAPKPAASPTDTTVDVKGKKTKFPDAKTAKMAKLLAAADPNHPVSLADAAAQSGLTPPVPGQDPGKQIPPADAKPGDFVVAGDKHYMVLGDGKFYDLSQYKNIDASELPHDMGSRAGYFRLPDPGAVAAGPVSGPTSGVPFSVPGATDAPTAPADTSAAGGPAAQPTAAHPPASAAQSVPSTGSPGVPKSGGSAPANAAATDTGGGSSVPSSTVHNLDPAAVK
ncbi:MULTISPECIES: hypothetical protein [unclassified Mycobacterium]|uniref:hypothetical protein n=1 Tax=unclassified Mycobacterium TaxID=2642494 RepID=UPI001116115A|nr:MULTISPECIES: hypothetical protein [unclassified Mycobacterium]